MTPCARPVLLLALLASCAPARPPAPPAPRPDPRLMEAIAMAASQIRPCYRAPMRISHAARRIVTVLGVHFAPDGSLVGLPEVRAQRGVTPENQVYAPAMAEAAGLAVLHCSPLHLPPDTYAGGWDDFELTFSFSAVA